MRGTEALLVAAFLGVIAIGAWNARQWLPEWGPNARDSARIATGRIAADSPGKADTKTSRTRGKPRTRAAQGFGTSDIALEGLAGSKTEIYVSSLGFPTGKDLQVGTSGVQIRAQYGEPTVRVTEMRGGHVVEHYYYFNSDHTRLTTATLESGVIVSAASTAR